MPATKVADVTPISLNEIKEIGVVSGPCVSILIPFETAPDQVEQNRVRLRHAVDAAKKLLTERGVEADRAHSMMHAIHEIAEGLKGDGQGLAVYCAGDFCRAYRLLEPPPESVTVAEHFYIKPLIPLLTADRQFYILALSQKHAHLLRCTGHSSEEVELPESVPKTLWEDKHTDQPDHTQADRSSAGPDVGAMKGVVFTTNTDREDRPEYLAHFYKHLSEGVTALLKDEGAPLVVAGVDYEIAAFKRVNTYPQLVEEAVHGAADGLKGGELHKRALDAMQTYSETPLKAALERYERGGIERESSTLKDIVKAAYEGRVLDLIVAENAQYMGSFDQATHDVKGHKQPEPGDEDLLNAAALQTLMHAGQVFVVPANKVPHGAPAVAVFRY
jgi:uncharacterized protein (UPF0335 family)